MTTITLDLWNDSGTTVLSAIGVVCTEAEVRQLDRLLVTQRYRARRLPYGTGRHITFQQFKKFFLNQATPVATARAGWYSG
jgi:hypothetical protein